MFRLVYTGYNNARGLMGLGDLDLPIAFSTSKDQLLAGISLRRKDGMLILRVAPWSWANEFNGLTGRDFLLQSGCHRALNPELVLYLFFLLKIPEIGASKSYPR